VTFVDRVRNGFRRGLPEKSKAAPAAARPRIISLSMVKNEQDIIEPFIRHNMQFLDCMIVIDNASVDDTRRILVECARETGKLIVSDSGTFAYTQAEQVTRLLQYCQTAFFADFIVLLDADEFISANNDADFRAALQAIPNMGVGLMPWQTHVLSTDAPPDGAADPPRTLPARRATEMPLFRKAVIRLDGGCRNDLIVWQGCHNIVTSTGQMLPSVDLDTVPLLHFPVRSRNQLCAKAVVGWMAYLAKNPASRHAHEGPHWRVIFDAFVNSQTPPSHAELCEISLHYAQERPATDLRCDIVPGAPPGDYVRRYSTGAAQEPLQLIARSWERSLTGAPAPLHLSRPAPPASAATASPTSFDADWHWNHLFADIPPFRFISDIYAPATVLDIGCGIGAYLKLFQNLGATTILGIDGVPADATALAATEYMFRDITTPLHLNQLFDLVICTEVIEHIPAEAADTLLHNIIRHASHCIMFSAAEPGQPGHGHINCQPIRHWLEKFAGHGWYPDVMHSLGIRALSTMSWLRRNLVVLRRGEPCPEAIDALAAIGNRPFTWYSQEPGIRAMPFGEPLQEGYEEKESVLF
jgi:SAM-dependent methyltransferase